MRALRNRLLYPALAALLLGTLPAVAPAAEESGPVAQVKTVDSALLEAMKRADELGFEGRFELLEPVLEKTFDFDYMAQIAVGRHWQQLDEVQRRELAQAFGDMSIATIASRFDGYSGETFEIGATRDGPRGMKLVSNRLIKTDGEAVPINFLLHETDEGWRIVDVLLKASYSELATKRSEYTSVVESQGVDRLIELLGTKVAELRTRD